MTGSVYKGTVKSVLRGMEAAFVDVGLEKDGFLYVRDVVAELDSLKEVAGGEALGEEKPQKRRRSHAAIQDMLKRGQDVLVQVVKEPIGTKGVRLTSFVSLPGRYLVLMPTVDHMGISRRIERGKERDRLKGFLRDIRPKGVGCIARTAGEGKSRKQFAADMKHLMATWRQIEKTGRSAKVPQLIHEETGLAMRVARDMLTKDIDRLVIDSRDEWSRIKKFIRSLEPDLADRVELYRARRPSLFEAEGVEVEVEKALKRSVRLKLGGSIVIEETEALVSIDVNSGRHTKRESLEKTALETNLEAADEIARQLRLRGLGGLIMIDFIDMESQRNRNKVVARLESALKSDRAKTTVAKVSELGIVEMTRERTRRSLSSFLCKACPYCGGTGKVESVMTTSTALQRRLVKVLGGRRGEKRVVVRAHPDVITRLETDDLKKLRRIERRTRSRIRFEKDGNLHLEDVRILSAKSGKEVE